MPLKGGRVGKLAGLILIALYVSSIFPVLLDNSNPIPPAPPSPIPLPEAPDMINLPTIAGGNITWNSTPCDGYSIFYWNEDAAPTSYADLLTKFSIDKPYYHSGDYVVVLGTLWVIPPIFNLGMIVVPYNTVVGSNQKVYAEFVFSGGTTYNIS